MSGFSSILELNNSVKKKEPPIKYLLLQLKHQKMIDDTFYNEMIVAYDKNQGYLTDKKYDEHDSGEKKIKATIHGKLLQNSQSVAFLNSDELSKKLQALINELIGQQNNYGPAGEKLDFLIEVLGFLNLAAFGSNVKANIININLLNRTNQQTGLTELSLAADLKSVHELLDYCLANIFSGLNMRTFTNKIDRIIYRLEKNIYLSYAQQGYDNNMFNVDKELEYYKSALGKFKETNEPTDDEFLEDKELFIETITVKINAIEKIVKTQKTQLSLGVANKNMESQRPISPLPPPGLQLPQNNKENSNPNRVRQMPVKSNNEQLFTPGKAVQKFTNNTNNKAVIKESDKKTRF